MPARPSTTVSLAFVRSAVQALPVAARAPLLAGAGIPAAVLADPAGRVPAAAFARLWTAVAAQLDDEFFGLDHRRMKVGSFASVCHALAGLALGGARPTVGQALRAALGHFRLLLDDLSAQVRVSRGVAVLQWDNRIAPAWAAGDATRLADARRFADETLGVLLHGLLCWLAGRRVPLQRLDLAHPAPPHADEYRRMFAPVLGFDAPITALRFDARVLAAAAVLEPASLQAFLRAAPQSIFLKQVEGATLAERARRLGRQALQRGEPLPTLAALAPALGLGSATLRRRLEAEGSGWQVLKGELRRERALAALAEPGVPVQAVAEQLGFADASAFYRAFRQWTGQTPGAWRAALASRRPPEPAP